MQELIDKIINELLEKQYKEFEQEHIINDIKVQKIDVEQELQKTKKLLLETQGKVKDTQDLVLEKVGPIVIEIQNKKDDKQNNLQFSMIASEQLQSQKIERSIIEEAENERMKQSNESIQQIRDKLDQALQSVQEAATLKEQLSEKSEYIQKQDKQIQQISVQLKQFLEQNTQQFNENDKQIRDSFIDSQQNGQPKTPFQELQDNIQQVQFIMDRLFKQQLEQSQLMEQTNKQLQQNYNEDKETIINLQKELQTKQQQCEEQRIKIIRIDDEIGKEYQFKYEKIYRAMLDRKDKEIVELIQKIENLQNENGSLTQRLENADNELKQCLLYNSKLKRQKFLQNPRDDLFQSRNQ